MALAILWTFISGAKLCVFTLVGRYGGIVLWNNIILVVQFNEVSFFMWNFLRHRLKFVNQNISLFVIRNGFLLSIHSPAYCVHTHNLLLFIYHKICIIAFYYSILYTFGPCKLCDINTIKTLYHSSLKSN